MAELERSLDNATSTIEKALLAAGTDGAMDESEEHEVTAALNDVEEAVEVQLVAARSASLAPMAASQTQRETSVGAVRSIRPLVKTVVAHWECAAKGATESSNSSEPSSRGVVFRKHAFRSAACANQKSGVGLQRTGASRMSTDS